MKKNAIRLGDLCEFTYGESLPHSSRIVGSYPVYGSNGIIGWHESAITNSPTIIIGRKGSIGEIHKSDIPCWPIDTTYFVDKTLMPCDFSWLYFLLTTLGLNSLDKSATIPGLNRNDAYEKEVFFPPLAEQKRIAGVLEKADRVRRLRRSARELSESFLQGVFLEMFGDPGRNPKGWEIVEFQEICHLKLGKMLDTKKQTGKDRRLYLRNENVRWMSFNLTDVYQMDFDEEDRKTFRLQKGDLLICEGGEVGRCAIWDEQIPECYYQKALHRARPYKNKALPEYVAWLLKSLAVSGGLGDSTSQVTIAHLTDEKLRALPIPLPPLDMQHAFENIVKKHQKILVQQRESERQAEELFQGLLARAFERPAALAE